MRIIVISWWRILLCALAPLSILPAQDQPIKSVKVRFRVFGWDNASSDLYYANNSSDTKAEVYEGIRSPFHDYAGPATITFYRLKQGEDGKMERIPAAAANLEDAGPWPLLLIFSGAWQPWQPW